MLVNLVFVPSRAMAQVAGATLSGTVADSSSAGIPDARLSIRNTSTNVVRQVTADSKGFYSAPNLLPGSYDVTATAAGFSTRQENGVVLTVGGLTDLNITLAVGQTSDKVEVVATPGIELSTSSLGADVNSTTIRELPLNGRDWTSLAVLQPGVLAVRTQASSNSTNSRGNRGFGNELSDGGHRPYENNYRMDGISTNDYTNGAPGSPLGINLGADAVAEFSVLTANYSAEYGRTSGAVINAITKSGTNEFHGDGFWFIRNQALDARNYFDPAVIPPFRRNQFGGSAQGPIRKNKTFIFGAYEGVRQTLTNSFKDTVPTADARAGIIHNADGSTTHITVDPNVAKFLPLWPLPNSTTIAPGNTGYFLASGASHGTEDYATVRVDEKLSDKDTLAGTYFYDNAPLTTTDALADVLSEVAVRRQEGSVEETHIFSPSLVNTFRAGLSRFVGLLNKPVEAINPLSKDSSLASIPGRYAAILTVPGLTTMQGGYGSATLTTHAWTSIQAYDDAFLTKGSQSIKFGFAFERMRENTNSRAFQNGTFTFPSLLGFLTNTPTSVQLLNPTVGGEVGIRSTLLGGYLQDDWHLSRNLTVNLGLRYEMLTSPTEAHNQYQFVQNLYGGLPTHQNSAFTKNPTSKNFEPRVGFSWDPFSNGKTAVRGGVGVFDVLPLAYTFDGTAAVGYPFAVLSSATLTGLPAGTAFPNGALSLIGFDPSNLKTIRVKYVQPDPKRSYVMNWNFNIQQQGKWNTFFQLGYVGSRSLHQPFVANDANGIAGTSTSAGYLWPYPVGSGVKINPNVGQTTATLWDGTASYHGLQAQVRKDMDHGIQAQVSYSFAKCLDNGTGGGYPDPFVNSLASLTFYIRSARHGACDMDIRQNVVGNAIWMLPNPTFGGALVKHLLGDWEMGSIVTFSTGTPFSLIIGGDPLGQKNSGTLDYPNRIYTGDCSTATNSGSVNGFVKLKCFTPPTAPASFASMCQPAAASVASVIPNTCMNLLGNAGRNKIYGPGLADVDFSLFKNIPLKKISETMSAQLRFEAFNLPNHANFQSPTDAETLFNQDGTSVAGAGNIDATTTTSRQIQFGLKVLW